MASRSNRRRRNNAARTAGKAGERNAKTFLLSEGCHVADTETQGLAGDDIFALFKNGKWYSVEVKNTNCFNAPKFVGQAKAQAATRADAIKACLAQDDMKADLLKYQGIDKFRKEDWVVFWHPKNCGARSRQWTVAYQDEGGYTVITDYDTWKKVS